MTLRRIVLEALLLAALLALATGLFASQAPRVAPDPAAESHVPGATAD